MPLPDLIVARAPTAPTPTAAPPPPTSWSGDAAPAEPRQASAASAAPAQAVGPTGSPPPAAVSPSRAAPIGTPVAAPAARAEFGQPAEDVERARVLEMQRRWTLAAVLGAIGKPPGPEAILAKADRPGPVEPGSLLEAVKTLRASLSLRG